MQFDLASDLHLDFYDNFSEEMLSLWEPSSDILVIAGDTFNGIGTKAGHFTALKKIRSLYDQVVMIMGNHDYYTVKMDKAFWAFKKLGELLNIVCLENEVAEVNGIKFAGTTLWFKNRKEFSNRDNHPFCDLDYIKDLREKLPEKTQEVTNFLAGLNEIDVIISHHMPSYLAVHPQYTASDNFFYVNPVDSEIERIKPKVWCFGHTHKYTDFKLFNTRLVCNPRGYPIEGGHIFQPKRIRLE